jgi:hypothetical protein
MKLSNRAKSALATAGYPVNENSAISQLAAFAAQNSGLEFGNYGDLRAYKSEQRSISEDWRRFKQALYVAAIEGVTDAEVIAAAPSAFSGRLSWVSKDYLREKHSIDTDYTPRWSYCTGQYFPTEYRKAAATVLEYATRAVKQARPPETRENITTIAELKALNAKNGGCWFDPGSMRFFGTRIESGIIAGRYFITSEQREHDTPRKFSVRSFDSEGGIDTVGAFHEHDTKADALAALKAHLANQETAVTATM